MSIVYDATPRPTHVSGEGLRPAAGPTDDDDGIHIAFVTREDRPFGPLLLVVVSWFELGEWVERTYKLKD